MSHVTPTPARIPRRKSPGPVEHARPPADLRERVLAQRRHILLQTGRDPLCGGLDD